VRTRRSWRSRIGWAEWGALAAGIIAGSFLTWGLTYVVWGHPLPRIVRVTFPPVLVTHTKIIRIHHVDLIPSQVPDPVTIPAPRPDPVPQPVAPVVPSPSQLAPSSVIPSATPGTSLPVIPSSPAVSASASSATP
jgi:hypothetical protein